MFGMRDLSNHIIAVANAAEINISNLQLQKIMFFVFGRIISDTEDIEQIPLAYDLEFRRWSYGPVVEEIYFDYNNFGGRPIIDNSATTVSVFDGYNNGIIHLLGVDPFILVEATHRLPSWADFREEIENRDFVPAYTIEDFQREFRRNER